MKLVIIGPVYSPLNSMRPRGTADPIKQRVTVHINECPGWERGGLCIAVYDDPDGAEALRLAREYVASLKAACEVALEVK